MRRIKLSQNPAVRFDFLSHVVWPNDEEKRDAYVALINESSVSHLADAHARSPFRDIFGEDQYDMWGRVVRDTFRSHVVDSEATAKTISMGYGIDSLEKEIQKETYNFYLAGYVVLALSALVRYHGNDDRLRGGPGIKKAQEVVEIIELAATSKVEGAWLKYKTVAHYCAAAAAIFMLDKEQDKDDVGFLSIFLRPTKKFMTASEHYRNLLTTHKSIGRNEALVSPDQSWLSPIEWGKIDPDELPVQPLPDSILENLIRRNSR